MMLALPTSTLFPYTTLFRSRRPRHAACSVLYNGPAGGVPPSGPLYKTERSEEHTSELQSRQYLVCRLLLEKKKETESLRHVSQEGRDGGRTLLDCTQRDLLQ